MRLKFSWRRFAALCIIGGATAGLRADTTNEAVSPTSNADRSTNLPAEMRAASVPSQSIAGARNVVNAKPVAPAKVVTPAATSQTKPPVSAAAAQRTMYQQYSGAHGVSESPNTPASRALSQYETANRAYIAEPLAQAQSADPVAAFGAGAPCGDGCTAGGDCGSSCGCNQCCNPYFYNQGWYVGGDFLLLRPNFSSPAAAVERTTFVDPTNNSSIITDRVLEYDIEHEATFRIFGGYRWGECGESLELSYWQMDTGESFTSPPATQTLFFASFEDAIADGPGEVLSTDFDMELNVFDLEYTKRLPVRKGSPSSCVHCCPPWDRAWSLGARIADYERVHNNSVVNAGGALLSSATIAREFSGAGPRVGFEGRRYLGELGKWSLYGTSHMSLLIGDYEVTSTRSAGITTTNHSQNFIRTAPVAEIEVGLSRQIGCRTLLTAGYQFQAWWDIGSFDTILIGDCECLTSSNVLSLDGLFVRLEHTFGPHCRSRCP
jgi:hypothetical protein